jgi:hypothetical protein
MVSSLIGLKHQKQRNMQQRLSRFKKSAALALALLFCFFANSLHAQWTTPTINGTIGASEYGVHTNGENQQTSGGQTWYVTWDDNFLYFGITNANTSEAAVIYIDTNPIIPINGGGNADGTIVGQAYDGTNFAELPFRANVAMYVKSGYREYRLSNNSGGWGTNMTDFGTFAETGNNREFSFPWSAVGGLPTSFAWFGYLTSSGGTVYGQVPTENAGGDIGTSARYSRYYIVNNTGDGTSTKPFSRNSYVFNNATDITNFGAITVYDFTMNTASRSITRTTDGSSWTINGALRIYQGTVNFGSNTGSCTVSDSIAIASGGTLTLSNTANALTANSHFRIDGTLNAGTSTVTFAGSSSQTLSGTATPTFHNITVNTSSTLLLPASFTTVVNGDFTINGTLSANSSSTVRFAGNNNTQAVSGSGTVTFGNVAVSKANSRTELVLFPSTSLTYYNPLHFGHSSMTINNFTLDSGLVYLSPVTGSGTFTRTISGDITLGSTPSSIFGNGLPLTPIRANTVLIVNNRAGATVNTTVNGSILEGPGSGYVTLILAGKDCNSSSPSTLTVNGDVTFTRPFSWNGNGTTPPSGVGSMTFNFAGNISITNPFSIFNGDRAGTGPPTINLTGSGKTVDIPPVVFLGGGPTTGGTNAQANWVIPSTASITIPSTGALAINMGRTLTVDGTLICADGAQLIGTATGPSSGVPTFALGSSGILRVADVDGLGDGTLIGSPNDSATPPNATLFFRQKAPALPTQATNPVPTNWDLTSINSNGTIEYNGTAPQTVTVTNYANLTLSGGAGANKTLSEAGSFDVTGTLTLDCGVVDLNGGDIRINNTAPSSVVRTNGHINNALERRIDHTSSGSYLFPIGDASTYRPVTLTAQASTFNAFLRGRLENSPGSTISSSYETPLVGVSQLRYYEFENRSDAATITVTQASLQVSSDDGALTPANTRVATFLDNDPYWSNRGGSISSVPSLITSSTFSNAIPAVTNNFWYAALGTTNSGDNPLPVELLSFTATSTAQGIKLAWETASEHESRGFTLLRKKEGESAWTEVASYQTDNALRALNALNGASYSFTDKTLLEVGKSYDYQLRETGFDGQVATLETVTLTVRFNVAREYELAQNYPNPFNPVTMIRYQIPTAETVSLKVYDVLGKEVATLVSGRQEAGNYAVPFNASGLSSGMYFYRLQAGSFVETRKMMLVK